MLIFSVPRRLWQNCLRIAILGYIVRLKKAKKRKGRGCKKSHCQGVGAGPGTGTLTRAVLGTRDL